MRLWAKCIKAAVVIALVGVGTGCEALLDVGSLTERGRDASVDAPASAADGAVSGDGGGARDGSNIDATGSMDAGADATMDGEAGAPPPPVAGKAGTDLTAAGIVSKTSRYTIINAVGESPGGNVLLSRSPHYEIHGGVVAGTQ